MKRKTYFEPPMKFNVGLKKYEPDLTQKPNKKLINISDESIRNLFLVCLGILAFLFILRYFFT